MPETLLAVFHRACAELFPAPTPALEVELYPYADIRHTIRRRRGRLLVRISDAMEDAPADILYALAHILLGKILRRRIEAKHYASYLAFIRSPQFAAEAAHLRASRARQTPDFGPGRHFDLEEIRAEINRAYFGDRLSGIRILWSRNRSRRRLGYYRECVHTVVISRALDHPDIPRYVVAYVVYHEMLHADMPARRNGSRRQVHTAEFYRREQLFEKAPQAEAFLRKGLPGRKPWPRAFRLD